MTINFNKKSNIVYLSIVAFGLLISCGTFIYYGFHLGIKPCQGLASDVSNCGDADIGGIGFMMIGVPIMLLGIISLAVNFVLGHIKSKR